MAIVHYSKVETQQASVRNFQPPKVATIKHWWKAARKTMPSLPEWQDWFASACTVTREKIVFADEDYGFVVIERQRWLR